MHVCMYVCMYVCMLSRAVWIWSFGACYTVLTRGRCEEGREGERKEKGEICNTGSLTYLDGLAASW